MFTAMNDRALPWRRRVQPLRDELLARAVLARDQHVRVRRANTLHELENRLHLRRLGDHLRQMVAAQQLVLRLQPLCPPQRSAELDLRRENRDEARVVPRLFDVVARTAPHRFDRVVDRAPGRHDDHRHVRLERLQRQQDVEPFFSRRRVARVVHVQQHRVVVASLERGERGRRRVDGVDVEAVPLSRRRSASSTSAWSSATRMCGWLLSAFINDESYAFAGSRIVGLSLGAVKRQTSSQLLGAQRDHGIDARGTTSRDPTRDQRRDREHARTGGEGNGVAHPEAEKGR